MTAKEFAQMLDGRQYRNEISREECAIAKQNGLVVCFGASDDLAEFRGAIDEEYGCWDGGILKFTKKGILFDDDDNEILEKYDFHASFNEINAIWDSGEPQCAWKYETNIPHSTFNIFEDGELYCIGIVFNHSDLI